MRIRELLLVLAGTAALWGADALAQAVTVEGAWVRGTVEGQSTTGAYMNLTSKTDAALVGATSPVAGTVEVHEMQMDGNVMKMRAVPRLELPAGTTVHLDSSGSYHVMLMDLKHQLKKGDTVSLALKIERKGKKAETVKIKAVVRDLAEGDGAAATSGDSAHHHHH